jgi:hypothetical protein
VTYSYAVGVHSTRPTVEGDASLADLRNRFRRPVVVSMTPAQYGNASKRERSDVKKALPYFVGGEVRGTRKDANVRARTMLTLDVEAGPDQDEQPPAPEDTFAKLKRLGLEGWVYTTLSHTADAPRYRVVLPLDEPITDALEATTRAAAKRLGLGEWVKPESWVLSQPMYLPAKLRGGPFYEAYTDGEATTASAAPSKPTSDRSIPTAADGWEHKADPVLAALRKVGHYKAPGKEFGQHFILCPWHDKHADENDSKTEYRRAHTGGYARPACKCMSTSHEELTHAKLVRWLREEHGIDIGGSVVEADEDFAAFDARAQVARFLESEPEERVFAWRDFAPKGKVTVLAGPGGVSKSMLMLHLLVHGALGQSFAGIDPVGEVRGLYVSHEDDTQELRRRMHRLAKGLREEDDGIGDMLYDVKGSIAKNVRVFAADEEAASWLLADKPDRYGAPERTARVDWYVGYLRHARMDVLVIDPAVYTHTLEESSPGDMAFYMQTLTSIAKRANVALIVLHHMHKTALWASLDDINQGSLRGASSFADNARSVAVMVTLPTKEAARFGLTPEQAKSHAVFKHVKHNYSASLGIRVFRRDGPRLVYLPDLQELSPMEAAEVRAGHQAEEAKRINLEAALVVLPWLQENGRATGNMIEAGCGLRPQKRKAVLAACENYGYVEWEPGPNRAQWWTVTVDGAEWLASQRKGKRK